MECPQTMLYLWLPWWLVLALSVLPLLLVFVIWAFMNRKRLGDIINLRFKRSRVVEARLHTITERVISQFVIPNSKGFVKLRSAHSFGWYRLEPQFSEWNSRYGIPIYDIVETQLQPALPTVGVTDTVVRDEKGEEVMIEMEVKKEDGTILKELRSIPPTVNLTFKRRFPQKLELLKSSAKVTAEEVHNMMTSRIVERLALAQAEMVASVRLIKLLVIIGTVGIFGFGIVGLFYLNNINGKLAAVIELAIRAATGG